MFDLSFNKDDSFFFGKKLASTRGAYLKKMTPNSELQFIHKESGNSMTTAKWQSARLLPHWALAPVYKVINNLTNLIGA